jgi:hypothetical protein
LAVGSAVECRGGRTQYARTGTGKVERQRCEDVVELDVAAAQWVGGGEDIAGDNAEDELFVLRWEDRSGEGRCGRWRGCPQEALGQGVKFGCGLDVDLVTKPLGELLVEAGGLRPAAQASQERQ